MPGPLLTHLALHVADLDRSIHFYTRIAGMALVHQRDDRETNQRTAWVSSPAGEGAGDFVIVLLCGDPSLFGGARPQVPIGPLSHLGFAVDTREDVDRIAERAREAGILLREPEYVNEVVSYICFVRDPDGHSVEFSHGQTLGRRAP